MAISCRQHAFIDAPLEVVWNLAADPDRQTEWWPDTLTFECIDATFEQGCHVRNVQERLWPMSDLETQRPSRHWGLEWAILDSNQGPLP